MKKFVYAKLHRTAIPQKFIDAYKLKELFNKNGFVYIEIRRGMYGLKQAGKIAHEQLKDFLEPHGYTPIQNTPGLWTHKTRKLSFTLIVDDFGVKYEKREDAEHLMQVLKDNYEAVTEDWKGAIYAGIHLHWDYKRGKVHLSMPGYIKKALILFQHPDNYKPCHTPHPYTPPSYGRKVQLAKQERNEPRLPEKEITEVRQVVGRILY